MNKKALKGFVLLSFLALFLFLVSCNKDNPGQNPDGGGVANPAKLTATVSKNYTVSLSWNTVAGTVMLERKLKDDPEFVALADVTGKTSFEDFPVLDTLSYSYRLKSEADSSEVSVTIPAVSANPLTVAITGDSSKAVRQSIPMTGGSIVATGADGTIYTLTIPEGALLSEREITLTPISSIDNLPLSGGLLGAVQISPEIEFYNYAKLTIQPGGTAAANTTVIGFAAENTGAEFYLLATENTATNALQVQQADESLPTLMLDRAGMYGAGVGTAEDARSQVQNHPPTSLSSQIQQASFVDDAPLPTIPPREVFIAGDRERRIRNELANSQGSLQDTFREYRQWLEYLRQNDLEARFLDEIKSLSKDMANKINERFDELDQKCQQEPDVVKEMEALVNWASKYPALVQNLGEAFFNEARDRIELCKPTTWEGTINYKAESPGLYSEQIVANVTWTYVGDESVLGVVMQKYIPTGDATVTINNDVGDCTSTISNAQIDTAEEFNRLYLDYSSTLPRYNFDLRVSFTQTQTCPGIPTDTSDRILDMVPDNGVIVMNEMKGSRTITTGSVTATNDYTFTKKTN
jgi:hypothetical protein